MQRLNVLKKTYFLLVCFLISIIVLTPSLISNGFSIFSEEFLEEAIIFSLLMIGLVINYFYEKETKKQDQALQEAWKHIGAVNLLVERFRTALSEDGEYPKSKKELQFFSATTLEKIRGVVHCECLLLRVIDTDTLNTVFEYSDSDLQKKGKELQIGNKELISGKKTGFPDVISSQSNTAGVRACLIFSKAEMSEDNRMVVQKIVNDFAMVYIISAYIL